MSRPTTARPTTAHATRRRVATIGLMCAIGSAVVAGPASADWHRAANNPTVVMCYEKVDPHNAFGGVYKITNVLANNSGTQQTGRAEVHRNGALNFAEDMPAAPGAWAVGQPVHLSMALNDAYTYRLNGAAISHLQASQVPWLLPHCAVKYTGNGIIDSALRYGLAQLDAVYVGGGAGKYRFGTPGNGGWHQMAGQKRYLAPSGVVGFDCSGLIVMMYKHAGIDISKYGSSRAMKANFPRITAAQLRPGDVIAKNGHVAVYLGDGNGDGRASVLEATPSGKYGDGRVRGVVINHASKYLQASGEPIPGKGYTLHRVPGL